jgi:hypothetical protein
MAKTVKDYSGACWNALMEEETKESIARLYIDRLHERRAEKATVAELVEALRRALPSVQSDAEMMAAIDRHNPLPAADMPAVTKAANELDVLVDDIRALLAKHAAKP